MVSNGFPNVTTSGQQYNIGEKPSAILYTYINLHAGTPKPQSFLSVEEFRTTVVVIWSYMVLEKLKVCCFSHSAYWLQVANPARGQLNRENQYSPVPVYCILSTYFTVLMCMEASVWRAF